MFMGGISDVNGFKTQLITWYKWGASLCVILMYPLIISQFAIAAMADMDNLRRRL